MQITQNQHKNTGFVASYTIPGLETEYTNFWYKANKKKKKRKVKKSKRWESEWKGGRGYDITKVAL